MNIGLLGGSFNPIHNAHLGIARAAREACRLERVIFIPAADPPHKSLEGDVSFDNRVSMVKLALADHPQYELSTIEGERKGKSYSIDTIRQFRQLYPSARLFFIIGADSYLEIGTWHRYSELLTLCDLVVAERPGRPILNGYEALPDAVRGEYTGVGGSSSLLHRSGSIISFMTGVPMELSSTGIRRMIADGGDVSAFVPSTVAAYISQQRIYRQCQ